MGSSNNLAGFGASLLFYVKLHDKLENKSNSYMDDIIAKKEKYFLYLLTPLVDTLKQNKLTTLKTKCLN